MKACMFHLMPYRDLPRDFQHRYPSVWVTPPSHELCDPAMVSKYYNWTLDEMELASELGIDGVCVNEHHQNGYGFMPSPNLMAAALARRTRDTALIVLGNTLPIYQPAIRVAEEFAMLDTISGGRLVAGFPVGSGNDVNFCYGVTPIETRPRFYEAHDLITQAWTRPGPFAFNGKFQQLRYVNPWPKPLQKPHPPIWLAGGGSVETWDFAVKNDYMYSFLSFFGVQFAKKMLDPFWERVAAGGRDANPYRCGFLQTILVSETDEQAEKDYLEHVKYFYEKSLHIPYFYVEPPGYKTLKSVRTAQKLNQGAELAKVAALEKNWKTFIDNEFIIAGSPATVRDRLVNAAKNLNFGHLMALLQVGSMPTELTRKNITLFCKEVLPHIRDLWDDKWTDHWWPQNARRRTAAGN